MTTFTITTALNMTALVGKGGGDTYNINGGSLTIDSDTRYGPNTSTATGPFGNISLSPTLAGDILVSGSNVRLIPFNAGNGNVPASGSIVTRGNGITAELLCVMSSRTGGTVYAAATPMPVTGWLKLRNLSGPLAAGNFTGINATATAGDEAGWIELVGVESMSLADNRLNTAALLGEWFYLGETTGARGQTVRLPAFGGNTEYPGVEIEAATGSGVYKFWPNAALKFRGDTVSSDSRCRYVGINSFALMTLGTGLDGASAGDLPPAGCKIRIPNIILSTCTAVAKAVNAAPSATLGTRYELNTTSSGTLTVTRVTGSWYWNINQPQAVTIRDLHTCEQFVLTECSSPPVIDGLHVGLSNQAVPFSGYAINISQHYAGDTTVNNISGLRAEGISSSGYAVQFVNCYGKWTINNVRAHYASDCTAVSGALLFNTCDVVTVNNAETIGKRVLVYGCANFALNGLTYADNPRGTTLTTAASHAVEFSGNTKVASVNGIANWPNVPNVHPYSGVVYINTTADLNVTGIGTSTAPFNAGTVNPTGYLFSDGGNNARCRFHRNWVTSLRLGLWTSTNSSLLPRLQNNYTTDASFTHGPNWLSALVRGNRQNAGAVPTSFAHVVGTHFWDAFTSDTSARAALVFAEKSTDAASLSAYTIDAGTPKFTGQGALVMAAGDRITWTWNYAMLGWTGLSSLAVTGTNATTNHSWEYDLDKGAGFSGIFKTLSNANLLAETGINPTAGIRPRVRVTCTASSVSNQLTSFRIDGTTTLALQNAALYPTDLAVLTITGLLAGSTVAVFTGANVANGAVPVAYATGSSTSTALSYVFDNNVSSYTLRVRKPGCDCLELVYPNAMAVGIPVAQQVNADGFGVNIYGRGTNSTASFVSFSPTAQRIDIGNTRCVGEDVYNTVADWQASATGITYPEALRFDGTDLLLLGAWRFRRKLPTDTSAGIDALPVINGNPTGSPDDEANGSVDFRARSVRTYQLNSAPAITAADMAAAVWGYAQGNGSTAEANLRAARTAAENAFAVSA